MKKNTGFTLIELMIVVAIIAIIAAIAIPNLLRSRIQSNESAAIGNLRTINGSEVAYHAAHRIYGSFAQMTAADPAFLNGNWEGTPKNGYTFALDATLDAGQNYSVTAMPQVVNRTGIRHFFADSSGVIRAIDGAPADATSPPVDE